MKSLTREAIIRMTGNGINYGGVGGGGGGTDLSGYATQLWVDENYLSKSFWNELFVVHTSTTTTVTDSEGEIISGPTTVTNTVLDANVLPGTTETTDEETGNKTTVVVAITNIEAKKGVWTNYFLSALGLNSSGGGGGSTSLAGLTDVSINNPTNGQVLKYNSTSGKWENAAESGGGGSGSVTSITAGTGLSGGTITTSGTIAISSTYQSYISHGETAYGWGNHANEGYATQTWVGQQGFVSASDVYNKTEADGKFLTIAAFENLFNAIASDGTTKIDAPYASSVASIKAKFGLWTNQYFSALGLNSGGGGGGSASLANLVDVAISSPTNGQVLMYNSTTGKWYNGTVSSGGGGTVTSIATGTGLTGGPITTSGTIAIDTNYLQGSVATQMQNYSYISSGTIYIGNSSITPLTSCSGTFWGKSWSNGGTISGSIEAGNNGGAIEGFHSIEFNTHGSLSGYGGFIDFHYNGASGDYTSRIIEDASGRLRLVADNGVRIGDCVLLWDSTAGALKVQRYDGTAAGFYATGFVSALGAQTGSSGSIAALTITESITFNDNNDGGKITTNGGPLIISTDNNSDWIQMDDVCSGDGQEYWKIQMDGKAFFANKCQSPKFYLDSSRYIYLDSGTLKYYNGSTSKTIVLS